MVPERIEDEAPSRLVPALSAQAPTIEEPARPVDLILVAAILGLVVLGTIEVYSSSAVYAFKKTGDAIGGAMQKSWTCMTTLFKTC